MVVTIGVQLVRVPLGVAESERKRESEREKVVVNDMMRPPRFLSLLVVRIYISTVGQ